MKFIVVWCYYGLRGGGYRESYRIFVMCAEAKDSTKLRGLAGKRLLSNRCVNHRFVMLHYLNRFDRFDRLGITRGKLSTYRPVARGGGSWLW